MPGRISALLCLGGFRGVGACSGGPLLSLSPAGRGRCLRLSLSLPLSPSFSLSPLREGGSWGVGAGRGARRDPPRGLRFQTLRPDRDLSPVPVRPSQLCRRGEGADVSEAPAPRREPPGTQPASLLRRTVGGLKSPSPEGAPGGLYIYIFFPPRTKLRLRLQAGLRKNFFKKKRSRQLLAVDHSARASMKNAASCEN